MVNSEIKKTMLLEAEDGESCILFTKIKIEAD